MGNKSYPCIVCSKNVTGQGKDGSIACCVCQRWTHNNCTDLHPEALKYFNKMFKDQGHHFYSCAGCSLAYHELNMRLAEVNKKLETLSTEVAKNTENNKTTSHRVDQVELEVDKVKKDMKASTDNVVRETTKAWSSELREREQLRSNIVIYGLSELDHRNKAGNSRKNHDYKETEAMLSEIGVETNLTESAKFVYRLGELNEEVEENPRPVKIGLRSLEVREKIFDKARNLPKTRYKDISIVPDLTALQRKEDKELQDEVDQLNQDMDQEESLNWHYRCVGRRGERVIRKLKVTEQTRQRRGRGGGAPHRGRQYTRPRHRQNHQSQPRTAMNPEDSEEEQETSSTNQAAKRDRPPSTSESSEEESSPGFSGTSRRQKRSKKASQQATH